MCVGARKHVVADAYKMLSATLKWRSTKSPEKIFCSECHVKPRSHSLRPLGLDVQKRPLLYSNFLVDNRSTESNVNHVIYFLEKMFEQDCVQETSYSWVMDYHGFGLRDLNPVFAVHAIKLFQNHYPER